MATKVITIKPLTYARLKNGAHDQLSQYIIAAIVLYAIVAERFPRYVELFRTAAGKEHEAYLRTQRKYATAQLNDCDADRIKNLRMLRDIVKATTLSSNPAMRIAAEKILLAIDQYGGVKIQNQSVEERSGNISNLIDDLETQLDAEVEALSLGLMLQALKETNDRYIRLYSERNREDAEYGVGTIATLRIETDRCMRLLFSEVNNAALSGEFSLFKDFICYVNVEISRLRTLINQNGASGSKPDVDEEVEEDFFEEEESSAYFHFLNGEHETFTGIPGTPYTIPTLGTDRAWKPIPTGFIPEVDTQYFEEVVEPLIAPEDGVQVLFKHGADVVKQIVVPVSGQLTEADYPEPPEGYHWNFTLEQVNYNIQYKDAGETFTVRALPD